jgi:hypothetical protein
MKIQGTLKKMPLLGQQHFVIDSAYGHFKVECFDKTMLGSNIACEGVKPGKGWHYIPMRWRLLGPDLKPITEWVEVEQ